MRIYLHTWVQNPYLDYSACMNEFLQAYYGAGWEYIREFIDMTIEKPVPENGHLKIYDPMYETLGFTAEDIEKADALWSKAKEEAENDTCLKNIERSEICWRYWKGFNEFDKSESQKLIADMKAFGITKVSEGDTVGPDGMSFSNGRLNAVGDNVLFPISTALYVASLIMCLVVIVFALKNKPRSFVYIPLLVLMGVFVELFGWHKRAFLAGVDLFGYWLTFGLTVLLFAYGGALMTRGKKKRLLSAIVCATVWIALYSLTVFLVGELALGGTAKNLCLASAYIMTGIQALIMLGAMMKKIIEEKHLLKKEY